MPSAEQPYEYLNPEPTMKPYIHLIQVLTWSEAYHITLNPTPL